MLVMIDNLLPFTLEVEHLAFFGLVAFAGFLGGCGMAKDLFMEG